MAALLLSLLLTGTACIAQIRAGLHVGVGIADSTGPIVEVTLMGYGNLDQQGTGLHLRQWSRAFVFENGGHRFAFVSVDSGMMGDGVRIQVLKRLRAEFGELYDEDNVMISATHTHSGAGGFLINTLFDLPSFGFSPQTFEALVSGIAKSIKMAHRNLQPGLLYLSKGKVLGANLNRSPTAYQANPEPEKARYEHDVDKDLLQLRLVGMDGGPIGAINWFAVHPTSMNYTNTLISSDNMGYASLLFEQAVNGDKLLGKGPFVAAFASSNLGDVSPNVLGPKCVNSNEDCDVTSKCSSMFDMCFASGPGRDMFESTQIIGQRIFNVAWGLWEDADSSVEVKGAVRAVHQYVNMPESVIKVHNSTTGETQELHGCLPAMGYSFAAGTIDGPFSPLVHQGTMNSWGWLDMIRNNILATPTPEDVVCHAPKPILLPTGRMNYPNQWQPHIVSTQVAMLGDLAIIGVPGEFTTMAGRRLRQTVADVMKQNGRDGHVILAGLSNSYSDYITTFEEYQVQRYEGASTLFGPHTLAIHQNQYMRLSQALLLKEEQLPRGPQPVGEPEEMISFIKPVVLDSPGWGGNFGDVVSDAAAIVTRGDLASATFIAGNPRNNLKLDDTYCTIEKQDGDGNWRVIATDANWDTKVHWKRTCLFLGFSQVTVEWTVPDEVQAGSYRIRHFGHYKTLKGEIRPYEGTSRTFQVVQDSWSCTVQCIGYVCQRLQHTLT